MSYCSSTELDIVRSVSTTRSRNARKDLNYQKVRGVFRLSVGTVASTVVAHMTNSQSDRTLSHAASLIIHFHLHQIPRHCGVPVKCTLFRPHERRAPAAGRTEALVKALGMPAAQAGAEFVEMQATIHLRVGVSPRRVRYLRVECPRAVGVIKARVTKVLAKCN